MKQQLDIQQLANEIQRQTETKRDFIADSRKVYMRPDDNALEINVSEAGADIARGVEEFPIRPHAHGQIAGALDIPKKYYDRMPNDLRAVNVNHWLKNEPKSRMIRTLDHECRAVVSSKYRPLDNYDLAQAVLPVLMEQQDMRIESCAITEQRMYIKALFPRIEGDVGDPGLGMNDIVQSGLSISNSEVGAGSLASEIMAFRVVCLNGLITPYGMRRNHVGKSLSTDESASELFSDRTREADDAAFWMKVQDTVRGSVTQASFDKVVAGMKATKAQQLGDPVAVVEKTVKRFGLTEGEGTGILEHLVKGGDLSGFGLLNAVTAYAQDDNLDYDRATDLEKLGGTIIELRPNQWQELAADRVQVQGADLTGGMAVAS